MASRFHPSTRLGLQYFKENYVVKMEVKLFLCYVKCALVTYGDAEVIFHAFIVLRWLEMNGLALHTAYFSLGKHFWFPFDGTVDWCLTLVWRIMKSLKVLEIKPRFISHSFRKLVTILNDLQGVSRL